MPARDFHVNLTNRTFPHNFDELGSTIIAAEAQMEQNQRVSSGFSGEDAEQSIGICQAYFMQNILPTSRGYSSVSFLQTLPPIPGIAGVPDNFYILRGASSASAVFVPTSQKQYIFDPTVGSWQEFEIDTLAPPAPTVAFLKQRSFVFYPTIGCFEYDFVEQEFVRVEFTGLNVGNILGICAAGAFLVAWDSTAVYWSSVNDPLDFTPSLSTGAGSSSILAIKGEIITCLPLGQDFVVYTATNAVGARQSGNVQLPFTFSEISGSEGIEKAEHVAYDTNQGVHITWTASGFQQVTLEQAGFAWPEFSDGVIRAIYSDYDENFNYPVLRAVDRLELKLNFISNRWVAVSIKDSADLTGSYTFALVYDTVLQRWGRLDVLHKDLMEFTGPNISRSMTYAELAAEYPTYEDLLGVPYQTFAKNAVISSPRSGLNFGVCLSNGSVYRAALYQTEQKIETTSGIIAKPPRIVLGKFKIFRTRGAMLHGFKVQRLEEGVEIRAHLHSYTGELVGHKVGFAENSKHAGHFLGRANADSFSLEFTGKFHLTDLVCSAADAGKRNQRGVALQEEVLCLRGGSGECVVVTDGTAELCVVVGGDPEQIGNVGSKYELQKLYDYGLSLKEELYNSESWAIFQESMQSAFDVLQTPALPQVAIDAEYENLFIGIGQLVHLYDLLVGKIASSTVGGVAVLRNTFLLDPPTYDFSLYGTNVNGNYLKVSRDNIFVAAAEVVIGGDVKILKAESSGLTDHAVIGGLNGLDAFRGVDFDAFDSDIIYVLRRQNVLQKIRVSTITQMAISDQLSAGTNISVGSVAVDPLGRWVAVTNGSGNRITLLDKNDLSVVPEFPGVDYSVTGNQVLFSPDGKWLALVCTIGINYESGVLLWRTEDWSRLLVPVSAEVNTRYVTTCDFTEDSKKFAFLMHNPNTAVERTIHVVDLETGDRTRGPSGFVTSNTFAVSSSIKFIGDGTKLVWGYNGNYTGGNMIVFNTEDLSQYSQFTIGVNTFSLNHIAYNS